MILTENINAPTLSPSCDNLNALLNKYKLYKQNDSISMNDLIHLLMTVSAEREQFLQITYKNFYMQSGKVVVQEIS